jgi:hypothetical protein
MGRRAGQPPLANGEFVSRQRAIIAVEPCMIPNSLDDPVVGSGVSDPSRVDERIAS